MKTTPTNQELAEACRAKLETDMLYYLPHAGLYSLEFRELPTAAELSAYATQKAIQTQEKAKTVKGKGARTMREHHEKMYDRWRMMATATQVRVEAMREKAAQDKKMVVYF